MATTLVRQLAPTDFFWLKDYDCTPLTIERDSVYLFFCVHFRRTSFVARCPRSGVVQGFLLGFAAAHELHAYVHFLYVAEADRNQGIGRALMASFAAAAADLGTTSMCLYTIRAEGFYRRLGFQLSLDPFPAELATYIQDQKGAVLMTAPTSVASTPPLPSAATYEALEKASLSVAHDIVKVLKGEQPINSV